MFMIPLYSTSIHTKTFVSGKFLRINSIHFLNNNNYFSLPPCCLNTIRVIQSCIDRGSLFNASHCDIRRIQMLRVGLKELMSKRVKKSDSHWQYLSTLSKETCRWSIPQLGGIQKTFSKEWLVVLILKEFVKNQIDGYNAFWSYIVVVFTISYTFLCLSYKYTCQTCLIFCLFPRPPQGG